MSVDLDILINFSNLSVKSLFVLAWKNKLFAKEKFFYMKNQFIYMKIFSYNYNKVFFLIL